MSFLAELNASSIHFNSKDFLKYIYIIQTTLNHLLLAWLRGMRVVFFPGQNMRRFRSDFHLGLQNCDFCHNFQKNKTKPPQPLLPNWNICNRSIAFNHLASMHWPWYIITCKWNMLSFLASHGYIRGKLTQEKKRSKVNPKLFFRLF